MISITVNAASQQACNAALSKLFTARRLPAGRLAALAVVTMGLLLRALDYRGGSGIGSEWNRQTCFGAACVFGSSLGYSLLGALYEWMMRRHPGLTHFEYQKSTALIGVVGTTVYQLLYTVPSWEGLVGEPMSASGVGPAQLVLILAAFGGMFNFNAFFQALVFRQEDGALGVGIVTAVRGAVVSVLSGLIFCESAAPWQCLTFWRGCSAAVVAAGGVLWTLHAPAARPPKAKAA